MTLLGGSYVRPAPAECSNPPPAGTVIYWRAHANVQRNYNSIVTSGGILRSLGVLGDAGHLLRCGGHTAHEPGSPIGVVHAIDIDHGATPRPLGALSFGDWLIRHCRSDADTSQIRFFNWRNGQFNYAGQWVADSGDWHCHLHFLPGNEGVVRDFVALYLDYLDIPESGLMNTEELNNPGTRLRLGPAAETINVAGRPDISWGDAQAATALNAERAVAALGAIMAKLGEEVERDAQERLIAARERVREQAEDLAEIERDAGQDALIRTMVAGNPAEIAEAIVRILGPKLASEVGAAVDQVINNTHLTVKMPEPPTS